MGGAARGAGRVAADGAVEDFGGSAVGALRARIGATELDVEMGVGEVANPLYAHSGYDADERVGGLVLLPAACRA